MVDYKKKRNFQEASGSSKNTFGDKIRKAVEELGEVSKAFDDLQLTKSKGEPKNLGDLTIREEQESHLKEELVDLKIVVEDMLYTLGCSSEEEEHLADLKITKWLDKYCK